jgi:CheY-like chemotaxis protein
MGMTLAIDRHGGESLMDGLRIGLAEDNGDQRWALRSLLLTLGHDVVCEADDGRSLVDAVLHTEVDLVITDLEMPLLDGLEAAEQITQRRDVPVILLSGHADVEHVVVDHEPVTLVVAKPISLTKLRSAIHQAMRQHAAR